MTEEQIFELASKYLDESVWDEWSGKPEDLLKFARAIHEDGYNKGYDEGWESSKESTEMNSMEGIYD